MPTMEIEFQRKIGVKRTSCQRYFPGPVAERQAYEYAMTTLLAVRVNAITNLETGEKVDVKAIRDS